MQFSKKRRGESSAARVASRQYGLQQLDKYLRRSSAPPPTLSGTRLRAARLASLLPQASVYHLGARRGSLSKAQRVHGAVLGLLVGDAMGVPYEFHAAHELPPTEALDMVPPPGFRRAHGVPPGTWSDDGAQALCLLESLLENGRLSVDDFVGRMLRWLNDGYMAVDARVFDVSAQTLSALRALKLGVASREAASRSPSGYNNGSLARAMPLALLEHGSDAKLVENAHLQSRVTHPHPRCEVSCALLCLWARYELDGRGEAWDSAYRRLLALYHDAVPFRWEPVFAEELIANYGPGHRALPRGRCGGLSAVGNGGEQGERLRRCRESGCRLRTLGRHDRVYCGGDRRHALRAGRNTGALDQGFAWPRHRRSHSGAPSRLDSPFEWRIEPLSYHQAQSVASGWLTIHRAPPAPGALP